MALIVVALITASVLSSVIKPTINLDKYISVYFEGYDNAGKATAEFDYAAFADDYGEKISSKNSRSTKRDGMYDDRYLAEMEQIVRSCINWNLDRDHGLKNGDVVNLTWICDENAFLHKYDCKIKYTPQTYTTSGLTSVGTFDPFDGVELTFEGIDGEGYAQITGESSSYEARSLGYKFDKRSYLSNGDIVKLSLDTYYSDDELIKYCIDEFGTIPSTYY